jgi:hypothetical protein
MEPAVRVRQYQDAVRELLNQVREWLVETPYRCDEIEIDFEEPRPGAYKIPFLTIHDVDDKIVVELAPAGAWIVAADGKVDVCGQLEHEVLVYWNKARWEDRIPEPGADISWGKKQLFTREDETGWYWIQDRTRAKPRSLNKEIFLDLVNRVQPL